MDRELLVKIWIGEESLLGNESLHGNEYGLTPVVPVDRDIFRTSSSVSGAHISLRLGQRSR